jgi:hypothetical protein
MISPVLYTGIHRPWWLWNGAVDFRLFVSHRTLGKYRSLPRSRVPWALDSGGFSELSMFGEWRTTPEEYVRAVARYDADLGHLEWAAPQDWMCEAVILAKTGLTVDEHQRRTVANYLTLTGLWPQHSDNSCPFMPVLQGRPGDGASYLRCAALFEEAGVRLADYPVVGVGTVCRIQGTNLVGPVARALWPLGLRLHWFGVKMTGLPEIWPPEEHAGVLTSFDSMAWSYGARRSPRMAGCEHRGNCANCPVAARAWRERVLRLAGRMERRGWQGELFSEAGEAA